MLNLTFVGVTREWVHPGLIRRIRPKSGNKFQKETVGTSLERATSKTKIFFQTVFPFNIVPYLCGPISSFRSRKSGEEFGRPSNPVRRRKVV